MSVSYPIVVYQALNRANGHRYIGITQKGIRHRSKRHREAARRGGGAVIGAAIRKHGADIEFSTLIVCPSFGYAKEMEKAAIAALCPEYNATKGGDGTVGLKHSAEARKKISLANQGSQNWLGKRHSQETRQKIRQSRFSGKGGPRKGTKFSLSDEERKRRGERLGAASKRWFTGRKLSEEMINKFCKAGNMATSKPVICSSTGEVFLSLISLSRFLNRDRRKLRSAIQCGTAVDGLFYQFIQPSAP